MKAQNDTDLPKDTHKYTKKLHICPDIHTFTSICAHLYAYLRVIWKLHK